MHHTSHNHNRNSVAANISAKWSSQSEKALTRLDYGTARRNSRSLSVTNLGSSTTPLLIPSKPRSDSSVGFTQHIQSYHQVSKIQHRRQQYVNSKTDKLLQTISLSYRRNKELQRGIELSLQLETEMRLQALATLQKSDLQYIIAKTKRKQSVTGAKVIEAKRDASLQVVNASNDSTRISTLHSMRFYFEIAIPSIFYIISGIFQWTMLLRCIVVIVSLFVSISGNSLFCAAATTKKQQIENMNIGKDIVAT
jgi:hypothetical protein